MLLSFVKQQIDSYFHSLTDEQLLAFMEKTIYPLLTDEQWPKLTRSVERETANRALRHPLVVGGG